MKVNKKGLVRLEPNEIRVGNFFVSRESDHMKICDLNLVFLHRVNRRMPVGVWLENVWARANDGDESAVNTLKVYIGVLWSAFSVAPDDGFVEDVMAATKAALERHPDWYGEKSSETDAGHDAAAREVMEMKEFEEEVRRIDENGKGDE